MDKIFFENDPLDQEVGQKRKIVVKIEFTPSSLTLLTANFFPLKRVLNKTRIDQVNIWSELTV